MAARHYNYTDHAIYLGLMSVVLQTPSVFLNEASLYHGAMVWPRNPDTRRPALRIIFMKCSAGFQMPSGG
jgi:hypothetical protein